MHIACAFSHSFLLKNQIGGCLTVWKLYKVKQQSLVFKGADGGMGSGIRETWLHYVPGEFLTLE